MSDLRAPFPYFGGKSRVAPLVWEHFGDVPNYVEPFFGSGAVLLGRPHPAGIETVNDLDCMVANFWRALQHDPDGVAYYADSPVNEADQHARHFWLVNQAAFREQMKTDPDYYDPKIAGWWVWGLSCWIGRGWCSVKHLHRQLPHLGGGKGVHRQAKNWLPEYLNGLAERLRRVRVCCGDWKRITGPSPTSKLGLTGIFLDPPYADAADRDNDLYATESLTVAHDVREWAIANGDNRLLRIALCGYEGEHDMPASWECIAGKSSGGYGGQSEGRGRANKHRERIWFSPHCLTSPLFAGFESEAVSWEAVSGRSEKERKLEKVSQNKLSRGVAFV